MRSFYHSFRFPVLAVALIAVMLCSCEYDFELEDTSSQPNRLNVICVMDDLSYPVISAQVAVPINKYTGGSSYDKSLDYCELFVNGRSMELTPVSVDGVSQYWRGDEQLVPGDVLSLKAKGISTDVAEASVKVPDNIIINKIDTTSIYYDTEYDHRSEMYFSIYFDNAEKGDCFELAVYTMEQADIDEGRPVTSPSGIYRSDETDFISSMNDHSGAVVFDYSELKDGNRLDFVTYYRKVFDKKEAYSYIISVRKVSDSYYRYSKSLYMQDHNFLAELGFSASNYSYSNIKGGFGVLAASSDALVTEFKIR